MYGEAAPKQLARSELEAARLGFLHVLRRKGMSPQFRERHAEDLFAQALLEYTVQLDQGKTIGSPVGWIINCAWHRAVSQLESRDWRPREVSTERAGEPADEDRRALPEEAFLAMDRQRKVREAVAMLPTYQRQLMALSYFEGQSVREAARQLRWTPSKAQRAHEAAQRQLHRLLGVESSDELQLEIGLAAFLSVAARSPGPLHLPGGLEAALHDSADRAAHLLGRIAQLARRPFSRAGPQAPEGAAAPPHAQPGAELGRRLLASGAAETAGAAASGGGWQAAEVCKAAVAACLVGGSLVGGAVLGAGGQGHSRSQPPHPTLAAHSRAHWASATTVPSAPSPASASASPSQTGAGSSAASEARRRPAGEQTSAASRKATRRESQERESEEQFSAFAQAAREAEAPSASGASDSSTATTLASASTPESPEEQREERDAHRQFRGGLP